MAELRSKSSTSIIRCFCGLVGVLACNVELTSSTCFANDPIPITAIDQSTKQPLAFHHIRFRVYRSPLKNGAESQVDEPTQTLQEMLENYDLASNLVDVTTDANGRFELRETEQTLLRSQLGPITSLVLRSLESDTSRTRFKWPHEGYVIPLDSRRWTLTSTIKELDWPDEAGSHGWTTDVQLGRRADGNWMLAVKPIETGRLKLKVRDSHGTSCPDRTVFVSLGTAIFKGKTDAEGDLQIQLPTGLKEAYISVPGVGATSTGQFRVTPNQTTTVLIPRVLPYSQVRGVIEDAARPGQTDSSLPHVTVAAKSVAPTISTVAKTDANFVASDLLRGLHAVNFELRRTQVRVPFEQDGFVRVRSSDVVPAQKSDPPQESISVWPLGGFVRDQSNRPLANALVVLLDLGSRTIRQFRMRTDDDGRYKFPGVPFGAWVVMASAADCLPEFARVSWVSASGVRVSPRDFSGHRRPEFFAEVIDPNDHWRADIMLPDRAAAGALEVKVVRHGQPVRDAAVCLRFSELRLKAGRDSSHEIARQFFQPATLTNEDGVASFTDLTPGEYAVFVDPRNREDNVIEFQTGDGPSDLAMSQVAVCRRLWVRSQHREQLFLPVVSQRHQISFRLTTRPDHPPIGKRAGLEVANQRWDFVGMELRENDPLIAFSYRLGMSVADVRVPMAEPDANLDRIYEDYLDDESLKAPYFTGATVFAVSNLAGDRTIDVPLDYYATAARSIEVQVQDINGKPVRSGVEVFDAYGEPREGTRGGTTDSVGKITLPGVRYGQYQLVATVADRRPLPVLHPGISNRELSGLTAVQPKHVAIGSTPERYVLQEEPVGYVRGRIHSEPGQRRSSFFVRMVHGLTGAVPQMVDPQTGEFVCGPCAPGKTILAVLAKPRSRVALHHIQIKAGEVVELDIHPSPRLMAPIKGKVLHADGTPAYRAKFALLAQATAKPLQRGTTNARGEFLTNTYRLLGPRIPDQFPASPKQPLLIAWLPGHTGATFVSLDDIDDSKSGSPDAEQTTIRLPRPRSLEGHVRVMQLKGSRLPQQNSRVHARLEVKHVPIRVKAKFVGSDQLSQLLSLETLVDEDGRFKFTGLTEGQYDLQAALEDVWLSDTVRVQIAASSKGNTAKSGPGKSPEQTRSVELVIGPPGDAALLQVKDRDGNPLPNQTVTIDELRGPLAMELHQAKLITNEAGWVVVDGVTAGKHTLTARDLRQTIDVPPLHFSTRQDDFTDR